MNAINSEEKSNSKTKWALKQIGGLYKRQSKSSGKNYLAGIISIQDSLGEVIKVKIEIYPNRSKVENKHFDYCIYLQPEAPEAISQISSS